MREHIKSKNEQQNKKESSPRYHLLDGIRGIVLISMVIYHASWNLVYLYDIKWDWYKGEQAHIWQQSICWTFIFLSGFCWSMGRRRLKRGFMVFGGGLAVTAVTLLVMPQNRIIFGVLTLIGSCMLLMIPLDQILQKLMPEIGIGLSFLCFLLTKNVNRGYLGFEDIDLIRLPGGLYRNLLTTYLGFPEPGFFSTDYFSLFPWLFLFITGYFLYRLCQKRELLKWKGLYVKLPFFGFLGRHSLLIYLLHQPVLYLCGELFF